MHLKSLNFWQRHPFRWVKCNCDEAFTKSFDTTGYGGIVRGNNGNLLLAFVTPVLWPSSTVADFEVVILAMELAMQSG